MTSIPLPVCWDPARISQAVTLLAPLGEEKAHYFLATHAPLTNILGEKGFRDLPVDGRLNEEDLYRRLQESWERKDPDRDISTLIYGEAGTGKSHLVNWLKLRCDFDIQNGLRKDVVPILIRRRSGSLKDALTQLIDQLGARFHKYLEPVRDALERLSPVTARETLLSRLALELGPRREDRNRRPLAEVHRDLKHLAEACKQRGFGGWLTRSGGVIDRTIRLLTEKSDVRDRDTRPRFTADELLLGTEKFKKPSENISDVRDLIDEFDDRKELRELAAKEMNEALDDAVGEMTGLSGGNLDTIFAHIRRDLLKEDKRLALFIEDVSAMSVLDIEVVKAVEPRGDLTLCPLLAVMGVTNTGWDRLQTNDRQRITHVASIGGASIQEWAADAEGLAKFTARYLNAIRLTEEEVRTVAAERRRTGGDVALSKCTTCDRRKECHQAFDSVTLNGVEAGLYPFAPQTPVRLLGQLVEDPVNGISKTPRGYLMHLFTAVVRQDEALRERNFPRPLSHVRQGDPPYWTEFRDQYCGGSDWGDSEVQRVRWLALFWIPSQGSAADAAATLEPLRAVLGLPRFSKKTKKREEGPKPTEPEPEPKKPPAPENRKLTQLLEVLREWVEGGELKKDKEVRELLAEMIRNCVAWDDHRDFPLTEWQRLIKGTVDEKYEYVWVDGQRSRPATTLFFLRVFPRSEETRSLIEALARYQYEGGRSWDFDNGELHKRTLARWLRRHEAEVLRQVQPPQDRLPVEQPLRVAVQLLALAAVMRQRRRLPEKDAELLDMLLRPRDDKERVVRHHDRTAPWRQLVAENKEVRSQPGFFVALAKSWQDLAEHLYHVQEDLRLFLLREMDVPQGRTSNLIQYVNPLPILGAAGLRDAPGIDALEHGYLENFWQTRFTVLNGSREFQRLPTALDEERAEVRKHFAEVCRLLTAAGYDIAQPRQALEGYLADLLALVETKRRLLTLPDEAFDALVKSRALRDRADGWGSALEAARVVIEGTDRLAVICFDPRPLLDVEDALKVADQHCRKVAKELDTEEEQLKVEGDSVKIKDELLQALKTLVGEETEESDAATGPEDASGAVAGAAAVETPGG